METLTQELSSKTVKISKPVLKKTLEVIDTIVPTLSAEIIKEVIPIVKSVEKEITTELEALKIKEQEFIESEKRRKWHLGYGKG